MEKSSGCEVLQERLTYYFSNIEFLKNALLHSSLGGKYFERLEFLGDRVLGLVIAHWLYKSYLIDSEGSLAKRYALLVSRPILYQIAISIQLKMFIRVDRCVTRTHLKSILPDAMEAVLGAIYLDGNLTAAEHVIKKLWKSFISLNVSPPIDTKTQLQEHLQSLQKPLPTYIVIKQDGPHHSPCFEIQLEIEGEPSFTAKGPSKQEAEKKAAEKALKFFNLPTLESPLS